MKVGNAEVEPRRQLEEGIHALGLELEPARIDRMLQYLQLLQKWNRTYNLTAIREPARMVTHHLLDSLAIIPHLSGERLLDVGTGAGLPGIPLAIALPGIHVTMLDSNSKKTAFVQQAISELGLKNAEVELARIENWQLQQAAIPPLDMITTRAYSELKTTVAQTGHLLARGARLYAMKGQRPDAELQALPTGFALEKLVKLKVPGLEDARHLAILKMENVA